MDSLNLQGKTALITGASRGIGEAIAKTLAAHGAKVILASRKLDGLRRVEEEIVRMGGVAESIACHVGKIEQIDDLFNKIKERLPRLDILINNAGTNPF